jgi:hypothetical protein
MLNADPYLYPLKFSFGQVMVIIMEIAVFNNLCCLFSTNGTVSSYVCVFNRRA